MRFPSCLVIILVTDQNISNLVTPLAFFSIDGGNPAIEIPKYQVDHIELLLKEQLLRKDIYVLLTTVTKKRQRIFSSFQYRSKVIQKHNKVIC